MATIKDLLIRIGVSDAGVARGVARVNRQLESVVSRVDHINRIGRVGGFAALAGSAIQLSRAFTPAILSVGQFASALAPAAGAVIALPAAFVAARVAMATFKLGVSGISNALKAMNKNDPKALAAAMKSLAPSARQFVTVLGQIRNSFKPIQRAVQQKMFAGIGAQLRLTASQDLPLMKDGLVEIAYAFNGMGLAAAKAARTPVFFQAITQTLNSMQVILTPLHKAVGNFIEGMARLIVISQPLLRLMGRFVVGLLNQAAAWLNSRAAAEKMMRTVDKATGVMKRNGTAAKAGHNMMVQLKDAWAQLTAIGRNVGRIFQGISKAMGNTGSPAKSLLYLITQLTKKMADWANSAKGQKVISQLFTDLQQVSSNLVEILPQLGGVLTTIFGLINSLPAPVKSLVLQTLSWSIVLSRFTGPIGAAGKGIGFFTNKTKLGYKGAALFGKGLKLIGTGLGKLGSGAATGAAKFGPRLMTAMKSVGKGAADMAAKVGKAVGTAALSLGKLAAKAAWTAIRFVASMVVIAAKALWTALQMAADWVIGLGPIAWIIAAVVAIVALVVLNWGTIKRVSLEVWGAVWKFIKGIVSGIVDFVGNNWKTLVTLFTGPFALISALVVKYWGYIEKFIGWAVRGVISSIGFVATLPARVAGWFASMARGAISGAKALLKYVAAMPGAIVGAFGKAGSWLYNAGKNILIGLWNGIASMLSWLWGKFSWITSMIPKVKGPMSVDKVLLTPNGVAIMRGLTAGIDMQVPHLKRTLRNVTSNIASGISPDLALGTPGGTRAITGAASSGSAGGGVDYRALERAMTNALGKVGVHMDGEKVGTLFSKSQGRVTEQRRRTG